MVKRNRSVETVIAGIAAGAVSGFASRSIGKIIEDRTGIENSGALTGTLSSAVLGGLTSEFVTDQFHNEKDKKA